MKGLWILFLPLIKKLHQSWVKLSKGGMEEMKPSNIKLLVLWIWAPQLSTGDTVHVEICVAGAIKHGGISCDRLILVTVHGLISIHNSLLCYPSIFHNAGQLWWFMNESSCILNLTNSGLSFDGGALGQLPRYITSEQLIQTFTECGTNVKVSMHNFRKLMPAVKQEFSGTHMFLISPLTNHFDGDSLVCLHSQQLSWILYKSIFPACMHVAL